MKLIIFSGFLGSGKTRLILAIAKQILKMPGDRNRNRDADGDRDGDGIRLAILENEIGEAGIDDKILNAMGYRVKSMLSGCICCTLQVELIEAINEIIDTLQPEYIIFEPTGIANPKSIKEKVAKYRNYKDEIKIISVADAGRWNKLMKITPSLIRDQMEAADMILINKCDLVSEEVLREIESSLKEWNPGATLQRVIALNEIDASIWEDII